MCMMPLGLLSEGEKAEVVELHGIQFQKNCCDSTAMKVGCIQSCRIEDMGIRAGKVVEMLNNEGRGALLVKIDEARIALARGMAMKVMVRRMA